jgi:MFS superfamily sulfate permease-like transporter
MIAGHITRRSQLGDLRRWAGALALLHVLEARTPRAPAPLMIMAGGILVVLTLADEHGMQIVGAMQSGSPAVS